MKIEKLAHDTYTCFTKFTRDGERTDNWKCKDDTPRWVKDMIYEAHDGMFPDDHKYEFVVEALCAIMEHEDDEDSARDSLEPDVYNADLTAWLASNVQRPGFVDEYIEDVGGEVGCIESIAGGQLREKQQVFQVVWNTLNEQLLEEEDEEEEDDGIPDEDMHPSRMGR